MLPTEYQQLRKLFSQRLGQTAQALLKNPSSPQVQQEIQDLLNHQKLLQAMPVPNRRKQVAIFIMVASFLIAAFLWLSRMSEIHLALQVKADQVTMTLADDWLLERGAWQTGQLSLRGASWIGSSLIDGEVESPYHDTGIEIVGDTVWIQRLWVERGASVEIKRRRNELQITVRQGRVEGILAVDGPRRVLVEDGDQENERTISEELAVELESIRFDRVGSGAVPLSLTINAHEALTFSAMAINSADFLDRASRFSHDSPFVSTVHGGKVKILDVESERVIHPGDYVIPGDLQVERLTLKTSQPLELSLQGTTDALRLGPRGFEKDLRPSRLEYFSQNKSLALIWAGILFVSSLLWKIRDTLW